MSDKMRMQAVDKAEVKAAIKVVTKVKLERVARNSGLQVGTLLAAMIEEHAGSIETTAEDLARANEIVKGNIAKREARKQLKGVGK